MLGQMGPDVEILKASTSKIVSHEYVQLLAAPDVWRGDLRARTVLVCALGGRNCCYMCILLAHVVVQTLCKQETEY